MTALWNPSDKAANVTLSAGNLTATMSSSSAGGVRCDTSRSTSKYYFELTVLATSNWGSNTSCGLCNSSYSLTSSFLGTDATHHSIGYYESGHLIYGNATLLTGNTLIAGSIVCFAVDFGAGKLWVRVNNNGWYNQVIGSQDPANGIGGVDISAMISAGAIFPIFLGVLTGDGVTADFGATGFAETVPSGYTAWAQGTAAVVGPSVTQFPLLGLGLGDMVGLNMAGRFIRERKVLSRRRLGRLLLPW